MTRSQLWWIDSDSFLIRLQDGLPDMHTLLACSGTSPGTYGEELTDRMLRFALSDVIDITKEYQTYYALEYPSLEAFALNHLGVDEDTMSRVGATPDNDHALVYGQFSANGDYTIRSWIELGEARQLLVELMQCEDMTHEDQK